MVYYKCCMCYIFGVFKEGEEQVYYVNLWYQWQHGVNAATQVLGEEDSQLVWEVECVVNLLNIMYKQCYGVDVKQWL